MRSERTVEFNGAAAQRIIHRFNGVVEAAPARQGLDASGVSFDEERHATRAPDNGPAVEVKPEVFEI